MPAIDRESYVWNALGVKPTEGDEVYSAGDQPIAAYDNWFNYAVSTDIKNLNLALSDHSARHSAGGDDEIDLQDMEVSGVARLHGNGTSNEFSLQDVTDGSDTLRIDMDNDAVRAWPRFGIQTNLSQGTSVGDDIVRNDDGSVIYDYSTGYVPLAEEADHADTADHAATADDTDTLDGYDHTAFIKPGDANVTTTGSWTFNNAISASITGNAATADHADEADTADYATNAGDSDTVDNYHAADLIDAAKSTSNWQVITDTTFDDPDTILQWNHTSATVYDRYKFEVLIENQNPDDGSWCRFWIQDDDRPRYYCTNINRWRETPWQRLWNQNDYAFNMETYPKLGALYQQKWIDTCDTPANSWSYQVFEVVHPSEVYNVGKRYPRFWNRMQVEKWNQWSHEMFGELTTDYSAVDTFELRSTQNVTGRVVMYGRNIGPSA